MRLNKPANLSTVDNLVINDQPINIVDDFEYLGSYGTGYTGSHWPCMGCICQTQVNTKIPETNAESQNSPFQSGMRLDIVVWLRDINTYGGTYRET